MKVVLVTGAGSGIGRLAVRSLMARGHHVYAGIRDLDCRNAERGNELADHAAKTGQSGTAIELDILDESSCEAALATVIKAEGRIDVVVHNAAHLYIGITEAFTPDQFLRSFDTNAVGAMRVNRAVLPHMRAAESGYLIWVGSGVTRIIPPFLAPYAAAKAAMDALADATSYDVKPYGIDTTIVMPGPFMQGTEHFPKLEGPADETRSTGYDRLTEALAANGDATAALIAPGVDADPAAVGDEIARLVDLPNNERPYRTAIDFSDYGDVPITAVVESQKRRLFQRLKLERLLPAG